MNRKHEKAVHRTRRILFNNDGDDALYAAKEPTPQGLLEVRTTPVLGTHVDTISYCTTLPFGSFQHNTQVGEVFTKDVLEGRNITGPLIEQRTDPLAVMVDCCRHNDIEILSSFRVNDIHDAAGYPEFLPRFKKEHPETLFGTEENPPLYGLWSGVDYGLPEIRTKALAAMTDICTRYDVDGIELDFWRHPPHFKRHAWGKGVLKRELEQMTQLVRDVRKMTEAVEKERGSPCLVAVRILESVELSRNHGLDILTWLKEHLVDLVMTGEVTLAPWEDLIGLGHQYGVPVYPCIRRSMWRDDPEIRSLESLRAQAQSAWQLGGDGVYVFNLFPEEEWAGVFGELGDPQLLSTLDKVYHTDPVDVSMCGKYLADAEQLTTRTIVSPKRPLQVCPGATYRVPLHVGDPLEGRSPAPGLVARVDVRDPRSASRLQVTLNGHPLSAVATEEGRTRFQVAPQWVRCGYNVFEFEASGARAVNVTDVRLRIECQAASDSARC